MNRHYEVVSERSQHRCEYCRAPEAMFNFPFEVEHIVPKSKMGSGELENLALSCRGCNLYKSDSMKIEGLSATGRATVVKLQMNSAAQLISRRWWMSVGLFP